MKKRIYIRADAGSEIGLGHVIRCMALAHMLKQDFSIHFVFRQIPESVLKDIKNEGFLFSSINVEDEFFSMLTGDEIVVLDHYELDSDYQRQVKKKGCKLVCIDDLHDREFFADLIINHSPSVKPQDYKAQPNTEFALGLNYALLRPAFLEEAGKERLIKNVETVFICFGGSDPHNITEKCLQVLIRVKFFRKIAVVLGAANQNRESIEELTIGIPGVELYNSLRSDEILELLRRSDLAIVPASGMLLETLTVGSIPLIGFAAENQKDLFEYFSKKESFPFFNGIHFKEEEFRSRITEVRENRRNWSQLKIRKKIRNSSVNIREKFRNLQYENS